MANKFTSNTDELRKIIKENIFFGAGNQEVALEFLDAIIENHREEVQELKDNMVTVEEKEFYGEDWDYDPDEFYEADYGLGTFIYSKRELNLRFLQAFENFIEEFKNNNQIWKSHSNTYRR